MKKFTLLSGLLILATLVLAQAPQAFKYQAVARNSSGEPLENQAISVQISILAGNPSGMVVYSERHLSATNSLGLFDLEIGNPDEVVSGTFAEINWAADSYFLKLELDETGGLNYQLMGVSQLLSVPYALFSENTANNDDADADPANELQTITKDGQTVMLSNGGGSFIDETEDADADPTNELQNLTQNGLEVALSQGGGTVSVADNDNEPANELQQVTRVGNEVTLSQNGGTFTVDDADANPTNELQSLANTKNGNLVSLEITGGTGTTLDVSDDDSDPVNELQTLTHNGLEVTLSQGGGTINVADNDNDAANELQQVSRVGSDVTLSINGGSFSVNDADANPANELQSISKAGNIISLSQNGGSVIDDNTTYQAGSGLTLNGTTFNSVWTENSGNISNNNSGKVGIGTTDPAPSAVLEVSSTTNGVLLPRLTYDQQNAIANPAEGLMIFCLDCGNNGSLSVYSNGAWRTFTECDVPETMPMQNTVTPGKVIWKWEAVPGASGYRWGISTNYGATFDMGMETSKTEAGIECDTNYIRYVWVYNNCGLSEKTILSQTISGNFPLSPAEGIHDPAQTSIVWNWDTVNDATGYKWNTIDDFETAIDLGINNTNTETGLNAGTFYVRYVWAYNGCGTSEATAISSQTLTFAIGQNYGGGIIFYLDETQFHGLVAANTDQSSGISWGCNNTNIPGTSTDIGKGDENTILIVSGCIENGAARLCNDLELNGYSDWFLPSKDELNQMYIQRLVIGGFNVSAQSGYWSSSQYGSQSNAAWMQYFNTGTQSGAYSKSNLTSVRAIRAF
ncbi:MAG: DUF1566 domain-containing protein [Bacteroidales bacterium]|nr:DUF1566 domain-containing protein [Bacteroidales bacterium]